MIIGVNPPYELRLIFQEIILSYRLFLIKDRMSEVLMEKTLISIWLISLIFIIFGKTLAEDKPAGKFVSPSIKAEFVLIPAGTFMMGEGSDRHHVTILKPFYIQTTEVTQGQWKAIMGVNPSYFKDCGDDCPVENVSWDEVQEFIKKLNSIESSRNYRLLTEAEWEYAVRAGTTTEYYWGDNALCSKANYGNSEYGAAECKGVNPGKTAHVGSYPPNKWGLYDMSGNVWEWCQDWYGSYPPGSVTDPAGPSSGEFRVYRGGSWLNTASFCRPASRNFFNPGFRCEYLGLRLAATVQ